MSEAITLLAMFKDIEPAAEGVDKLQQMGLKDDDMNVISGIPVKHTILGRPAAITYVSRIGLVGAIMGVALGIFLIYGIPYLYPLRVGGQPIFPVPQGLIITFEMTMLGLMGFSFIGMFVDSGFPSYTPKQYTPEISNGKIAVLFSCPTDEQEKFTNALKEAGAESVEPVEARHL
ncbi:MAG TPA: quinol:electron acceptor oxidoreductase subunit ActD [Anaerolineales bacterium]|nr:quinol:electron acceptor oxidoreductase subunit ActD [Anaerolineales bacterium]